MNNDGILTTEDELTEANYIEYKTISEPGIYTLRLMFRSWYKNGLICYFTDRDNRKLKLYCFKHNTCNGEIYNPRDSLVDFRYVSDGTIWLCITDINKRKKLYWKEAIEYRLSF